MSLQNKTIQELVSDNHAVASALHFLGVHFTNYSEENLSQLCAAKGWKVEWLISSIEDMIHQSSINNIQAQELPIDLLIEYLKHNHFVFIKRKLPFLSELIKNFEGQDPQIKEELKLVFPLFVEDFIHHIYEEEDTLFYYILLLHKAQAEAHLHNKAQSRMLEYSIKAFEADHAVHEDQLKGLREMTNNFEILDRYDLHTKVVLSELKKLDDELSVHAKVENTILFPKALELERLVLATVRSENGSN